MDKKLANLLISILYLFCLICYSVILYYELNVFNATICFMFAFLFISYFIRWIKFK